MSACHSNPLVSFLKTYGPSPEADMLSDENVRDALDRFDVAPLEIPAPRLDEMVEALCGDTPRNVILTGTAGDGKTYHIRQFLLGKLALPPEQWPGRDPVLEVELPNGAQLRVIRDLSELEEEEKDAELAGLIACLKGERSDIRYLVAANDGQLLRYFRSSDLAGAPEIQAELARMLRFDRVEGPLDLALLNLSRTWSRDTVERIFGQILDHPQWDEGCEGCPGTGTDNPCPIRLNRALLRGDLGVGSIFRDRIEDVLRLGAANDSHVPIRFLIMLGVNILLGDRTTPDDPMLDCARARVRASRGQYAVCNPYENALGLNVPSARRSGYVVFHQMAALGLGEETNNLLDDALTRGVPEEVARHLFEADLLYGEQLFEPARRAYYVTADRDKADEFRRAIATQRRRAFFRLPDAGDGPASPWRLTMFHHAGLYLKVMEGLEGDGDKTLLDQVTRRLVKGLNRAYLGMMAEESDKLWLAGTIGRTDDTVGRIATVDAISRAAKFENIRLEMGEGAGRPRLRITSKSASGEIDPLDLRPLLFEYLLRVEEGSLPSSFSRQCQQEIRQFALIAAAAFGEGDQDEELNAVHVLSLGSSGQIDAKMLEV
ncbi:hypothetical protein [Sphingopyxis panaciterrulae]|uniref:Uncharacterized protein n=2 Tax=Sphingopyxis TaxID=165697 RepID=A0A7W9ETM7_9SPHN|nr:hypothetical protein [Sphingopyxis panaciterrulae]MBB5708375.1 hypothetical protein [Sphingopyxis panaciterrulae]SBV32636.1 conserved protein of unknown function [uncultured Sphingopyxis sp.]